MLIQLGKMSGNRVRFQIWAQSGEWGLGLRAFGRLWMFKTPKSRPYFTERHSDKIRWVFRFRGYRLFGVPDRKFDV